MWTVLCCVDWCVYMMLHFYFLICTKENVKGMVVFIKPCWLDVALMLLIHPGHISSLIKPDMLDPAMTRLVTVNSIYFKGLWKSRFQPTNTKMRPFKGGDGNEYSVPMMSQLSVFNIGEYWCMRFPLMALCLRLIIGIYLIRAIIQFWLFFFDITDFFTYSQYFRCILMLNTTWSLLHYTTKWHFKDILFHD